MEVDVGQEHCPFRAKQFVGLCSALHAEKDRREKEKSSFWLSKFISWQTPILKHKMPYWKLHFSLMYTRTPRDIHARYARRLSEMVRRGLGWTLDEKECIILNVLIHNGFALETENFRWRLVGVNRFSGGFSSG
jgi:hypothetical protein